MDLNGDGFKDILVGSFDGGPYLIKGSKAGYGKPEAITDANNKKVLIDTFWNYESKKWDNTDRAKIKGHCTSASAVDWDNDGDFDLLLGDYYGGLLVLRLNEGTAKEPRFATTNRPVNANGKQIVIKTGLAAPRVVDWNRDGLFDILLGGSKGGVYYYKNTGNKTTPRFAKAEMLIDVVKDSSNSFIKQVPSKNGQPTLPGSSYHIEPVDYDGDGDLDLLVGGRSSWLKGSVKKLTAEEEKRSKEVNKEYQQIMGKLMAQIQKAKTEEEKAKLTKSEEYKKMVAEFQKINIERMKFRRDPTGSGDFVWLYRRKPDPMKLTSKIGR